VNVLITGGTGFIGSRLGLRCIAAAFVRILGQENTPAESSNRKILEEKGARIRLGSVTRKELLPELLEGTDVVFHLAAAQHEVNVPDERFREVNVRGTANLLEAAVRAGVKRFVHGSTIGVHGQGMEGRIDENTRRSRQYLRKNEARGGKRRSFLQGSIARRHPSNPETYGPGIGSW